LATHGLADETETASFSSLAVTVPRVPVPGDDGFLSLVDLFERWRDRLRGSDLVVLSACGSQRGRLEADEGMYALPWGFCFAGCPSVVASLWKVSDESTADLMSAFYVRLLAQRGERKCEALAEARRVVARTHPDPYHWAPFVFLGDPR
jgi:CHAT domain-containing protein